MNGILSNVMSCDNGVTCVGRVWCSYKKTALKSCFGTFEFWLAVFWLLGAQIWLSDMKHNISDMTIQSVKKLYLKKGTVFRSWGVYFHFLSIIPKRTFFFKSVKKLMKCYELPSLWLSKITPVPTETKYWSNLLTFQYSSENTGWFLYSIYSTNMWSTFFYCV